MFTGSIVAMVTPFKDGVVDYDKLGELVDYHVENGTNAIIPCGTTGESPTLTHSEHGEVIGKVIETANRTKDDFAKLIGATIENIGALL